MNPQVKKIVVVVVLFVLAGAVLWWRMQPSDFDKQYQANLAKGQAAAPAATPAAAPAPGSPAASPGVPAPPQSSFQEADVDIAQLLQDIQEVNFSYDEVRLARDPMTPLVGPMAPRRLGGGEEGAADSAPSLEAQLAVRTMTISGIIWDPENPVAVVDDEVVTIGYAFSSGVIVEKIEPDRVIMRVNESLVPIELKEP
ncbi:MAG: hypothetical protein JXR94_23535 [Candidatus Hydrogenedentes bacterium]|nr:hypothetical protein [Candidatus Hydrogenedentota bacterium]